MLYIYLFTLIYFARKRGRIWWNFCRYPLLNFLFIKKCTLKRNQEANNIWQSVSFLNGRKTNHKRTIWQRFCKASKFCHIFAIYNFLASYRFWASSTSIHSPAASIRGVRQFEFRYVFVVFLVSSPLGSSPTYFICGSQINLKPIFIFGTVFCTPGAVRVMKSTVISRMTRIPCWSSHLVVRDNFRVSYTNGIIEARN